MVRTVRPPGNAVVVRELLRSGYRKVDARNPDGLTALHLACLKTDTDVVRALLEAGARVRVRDSGELSPLHVGLSTCLELSPLHVGYQLVSLTVARTNNLLLS